MPPKSSVTLTIPFYTQLLPTTPANLGKVNDQFVDWWNAMRVYVFDGKDAADAAYNYSVDRTGNVIPPIPVNPVAGAALPSCASSSTTCEPLVIKAYVNGFPTSVPAQLVEYTFAAAQGPPLNPTLSIDRTFVNFNISAVDQVYLPAAIGARGNPTPQNTYLGSTQDLAPFRGALGAFTANGTLWPFYVPAYFTAQEPTIPLPRRPRAASPIPSRSCRRPTPSTPNRSATRRRHRRCCPRTRSSGIGVLGQVGAGHARPVEQVHVGDAAPEPDLHQDPAGQDASSPTATASASRASLCRARSSSCRSSTAGCRFPAAPRRWSRSRATTRRSAPIAICSTISSIPPCCPQDVFNPYVKLIHQTLASNAYAFSIDDAVAFKSLPGDGIVITIAGAEGLENQTQTPLPTASTYRTYCEGGGAGLGAPPPAGTFLRSCCARSGSSSISAPSRTGGSARSGR